jgi:hypothetical protein
VPSTPNRASAMPEAPSDFVPFPVKERLNKGRELG